MQQVLPVQLAGLDIVKSLLHMVCELEVNNVGEPLHHQFCNDNAEIGRLKVLAVLDYILVGGDGRNGRRIG